MFKEIRDLIKLYRLRKVENKIAKLSKKKRQLISKLQWSPLLPVIYKINDVKVEISASFTYDSFSDESDDVVISVEDTELEAIQVKKASTETTQQPCDLAWSVEKLEKTVSTDLPELSREKDVESVVSDEEIQTDTEVMNNNVEENVVAIHPSSTNNAEDTTEETNVVNGAKNEIVAEIDVRIVAVDFEKEEVFVQLLDDSLLENGNTNLVPVGADKEFLVQLNPGEKCLMTVYADQKISFLLENGETIAC